MTTTLDIDDDLLRELETRAQRENVAVAVLVNRAVRKGLDATSPAIATNGTACRAQVFDMGEALFPVEKALSYAATLEDEENVRRMARHK